MGSTLERRIGETQIQSATLYPLGSQELDDLRAAHRRASNVREAYRINAVILLGRGHTVSDVADALLIDADTVRSYFKRYNSMFKLEI